MTHIGICVSNLPRAMGFYTNALGFREVGRHRTGDAATAAILEVERTDLELVYLERDGWRIELLHYASPGHRGDGERRLMNELGLTHLSFAVDDLDAVARMIAEHGGQVLEHTQATFKSGNRGLFALDPDGTRIELIERRAEQSPGSGN